MPYATNVNAGDEVTDTRGRRGIVSDAWIKERGQYKGRIEVVFIGNRYGAEGADPAELTVITVGRP